MKVYELLFDGKAEGVFRISLVKDPAIEATLVHFSKEEENKMCFINEELRIVYAPAMIPNKMIFRKDINGEPANVYYTEDTIKKCQQEYFKNNYNKQTNLNHEIQNVDGVYLFESWMVNDSEMDKSKSIGIEAPKGTWMTGHKVDNEEVWQQCKSGDLDGLSIEASLLFKPSTNFKKEKMNLNFIKEFIKTFAMANELKEIATGVFAEDTSVGTIVTDKEGNIMANAEFVVDGLMYETDDMGAIIAEGKAKEVEEPEGVTMATQEEFDALKAENEALKAELQNLKAEKVIDETALTTMKSERDEAKTALVNFKAQTAAANYIKNTPKPTEQKEYDKMTNYEKMKFNSQK